jgi:hypothetical protein
MRCLFFFILCAAALARPGAIPAAHALKHAGKGQQVPLLALSFVPAAGYNGG